MQTKQKNKTFKLTFKTSQLLDWFNLPQLSDIEDWEFYDIHVDLTDTIGLEIEELVNGELIDKNGTILNDNVKSELEIAVLNACEYATKNNGSQRILDALEQTLEHFQNFKTSYCRAGVEHIDHIAQGIISIDKLDWYTTELTVDADLIDIINTMIDGYGLIIPTRQSKSVTQEDLQCSFWNLKDYWLIYGGCNPQPDFDNCDDFDEKYFAELVKEIEKEHNINVRW